MFVIHVFAWKVIWKKKKKVLSVFSILSYLISEMKYFHYQFISWNLCLSCDQIDFNTVLKDGRYGMYVSYFNKMLKKKNRWELPKDAVCRFEQILEATPLKTAVVQPLTSHLTSHASNDELKSKFLTVSCGHRLTSVSWLVTTCRRVKGIHTVSTT